MREVAEFAEYYKREELIDRLKINTERRNGYGAFQTRKRKDEIGPLDCGSEKLCAANENGQVGFEDFKDRVKECCDNMWMQRRLETVNMNIDAVNSIG